MTNAINQLRIDASTALAKFIAYQQAGKVDTAQEWRDRLLRVLDQIAALD